MKTRCFALILLLVGQSVSFAFEKELKELSATLAESIAKSGKQSVAVVDFSDLQGNVTDGGRFLAEEFTVDLAASGKGFKVIERSRLKTILEEHKLASTGIIDPQTAKKLGQIAGVDTLITGIVTPLGANVRLAVKVLAVDTAEVIGGTSGDVQITEPLQALFAKTQTPGQPDSQTSSEAGPATSVARQQIKNYNWEITECKLSGDQITCRVLITNRGADRKLTIYGRADPHDLGGRIRGGADPHDGERYCRIIDDAGNEYPVDSNTILLGISKMDYRFRVIANVVSGVATKAILTFSNVSPQVKRIALLEVMGCDEDNKDFKVQFRNIPLTKE